MGAFLVIDLWPAGTCWRWYLPLISILPSDASFSMLGVVIPSPYAALTIGCLMCLLAHRPLCAQQNTNANASWKKAAEPWQIAGIRAAFGDSREPYVEASAAVQREALELCSEKGWAWVLNPPEIAVYLHSKDPAMCSASAVALSQIGSASAPFAKQLVDFLSTPKKGQDSRQFSRAFVYTANALAQCARDGIALDELMEPLLKDPDRELRGAAMFVIGYMRPPNERLVKEVAAFLQDKDDSARSAAAQTLGNLGESGAPFAQDLGALLESSNPQVRGSAAVALANIGKAGTVFTKQIVGLLDDPRVARDEKYQSVLAKMGQADPAVAEMVAAKLRNEDRTVHSMAALVLGKMGKSGAAFAKAVATLLEDSAETVRDTAGNALGAMSAADPAVAEEAEARLKSPNAKTRSAALRALGQMGGAAAAFADEIAGFMDDRDVQTRKDALSTLGKMGPTGRKFANRIGALLHDTDPHVRAAAIDSLGQMEHEGAAFSTTIAVSLENDDSEVITAAKRALGELGKLEPDTIVPLVAAHLHSATRDARIVALQVLGVIGPRAESAKEIAPALHDDDVNVRRTAIHALGNMAKAGAPYAKEIAASFSDPENPILPAQILAGILDQWGNPNGDWDLQCELLSKTADVPHAKIPEWRAHLRLWAGGNAEMQRSVTWLGQSDMEPMPKDGLSGQETRETLALFAKLWKHSEGKTDLRKELAGRITQVARRITAKPDEETLAPLQDLAKNVPDLPEWQAARNAIDEAIRRK